nr:DUF3656 domain-containing protein [Butyrivibrio sp.]
IYRKYIDLFMKKGPDGYVVSDKDRNKLKSLYLRTDISEGYMNKHNGKEMITLVKPGYNGVDENLVKNISEKYLNGPSKISISLDVVAREGELLKLTGRCNNIALQVFGDEVSEARKVAMTYDDFYKSLSKFGDTYFELKELKADIGDNVFVPVKQLNELRRTLASQMSERIIENNGFENKDISYEDYPESIFVQKEIKTIRDNGYNGKIHVHVKTWDQLIALTTLHNKPSRIYLDIILYLEALLNNRTDFIENFPNTQFYVALPYIAREEYGKIEINMINDLEYVRQTAVTNGFTGVLVRNMEELGYFLDKGFNGDIVLDYGVYVWNHESLDMLAHLNFKNLNVSLSGFCYPYELTRYECRELFNKSVESGFNGETSACIYGKVPMMITAGCVKRNLDVCTGKRSMLYSELVSINDRKKANFSVSAECRYCYNIIWNSVPNSQHKGLNKLISDNDCDYYRIDFTTESAFEVLKVYNYFLECFNKKNESSPEYEYTTGHFKQAAD